jgi:hypothetical protein
MNKILKSVLAVLAGLITVFVLSVVTDHLLELGGFMSVEPFGFNPWWICIVVIISRCTYTIAGAYFTAKLAPSRPMVHAMVIGIAGLITGTSGTVMMWGNGAHWFLLVLTILPIPCAWIGAKLKKDN